jgi:putative molybdopterin biosynthesis protein
MASSEYLYNKLAEVFRKQILSGEIKPGEKLPSVRAVADQWTCTVGTVQKTYQLLSEQGLVSSHAGQGTIVIYGKSPNQYMPYRRAQLLHRSESFLLEVLGAGYDPDEVEDAVREALDRLSVVQNVSTPPDKTTIRFNGSHDLMVAWIATHFNQISPGFKLQLSFTGSLHGLIALENNQAEFAGCHLWDEATDSYNIPFIQKLLPGKKLVVITLVTRTMGLMVAPGNPSNILSLEDIIRPGIRFINRQDGSGIRVWFDAHIRMKGISSRDIDGYDREVCTHSDVALEIAEKKADTGLGLEAAALQYGLDFIPLTQEQYDLVFPNSIISHPAVSPLLDWLTSSAARKEISKLPGYQTDRTGNKILVN